MQHFRLHNLDGVRVSLSPATGWALQGDGAGRLTRCATFLGCLTLGTIVIDTVAGSETFLSVAWLLPTHWARVRPLRARDTPAQPGAWLYSSVRIEWVDWPGVYLAADAGSDTFTPDA